MNIMGERTSSDVQIAASLPERLRAHADLLGVYTDTDAVVADLQEAAAKIERLKADYLALSRWAGQQNAGNAFATQVRLSADARVMEWELPLEEWEP